MKVGIIGGGGIAKLHGTQILNQPNAKLVGIADTDVNRAASLAAELKAEQYFTDATIMIQEQKPDIVHILVPPQYHAELGTMAMNLGCHVFVEKPMALSVPDAKRMIETANQNKVILCVNHNMVFEEVVQKALKLTSTDAIGDVVSIEAHFSYNPMRNPAWVEEGAKYCHWSYRLNGGPLQDLFPHPASVVMEFLSEINEVQSIGHSRGALKNDCQDEIRVLVKSNDVIGYISMSLNEKPDVILLAIKGTKGIIEANLINGILTYQKHSGLPRAVIRGISGFSISYQNFKQSFGNVYKFARGRVDKSGGIGPIISKLYSSIENGGEIPISAEKSLNVVDLMNRVWPAPVIDFNKTFRIPSAVEKREKVSTALVTGSSGFLGTHLIKKLLSENIAVRALVRPNSIRAGKLKNLDVDVVEGNLSDADVINKAVKGIKTIFHAGSAMSNNWDDHYNSTIKGTENLIKAALDNQVERIVHLSTLAVYELNSLKKNKLIKEDSPYQKNPRKMGPYAFSKIEAEKLLIESYQNKGLPVSIVRPGMIVGPSGHIFFPHFGYRYQDKMFLIIGGGSNILPLTYVENTVDGIYRASIEQKAVGQIYNLIDDGEFTVKEYLELFMKVTGIQARIINLPYVVPYLATTAYEIASSLNLLKKGVTSRAQLKWKQSPLRFDSSKAKNELGWNSTIPLEEGLKKTFEWYSKTIR
jgi:nucleoside-diphosphate-sugar epimerase/predicted dehydrogenase